MIRWIISFLKGEKKTAFELVKGIVKRLEIEVKDTSDFSSQMEKLKLLFGKPYAQIKRLAEDETINASKTPDFNKYFGGISDILASILWLIKKIRKNNEIFSLELKELTRLDEGNSAVYSNLHQTTSNFEKYLKKILNIFSEMQKMSIEGNIAGMGYKYGKLTENLEKLHKNFYILSNRIEYTKKMLQENKNALEEIVEKYRANLEAQEHHVSPSLIRWILITSFSINATLGCGSVPKVESAAQPTVNYSQPKKEPLTGELYENPSLLTEAARQYRLSHLDSPLPYDVYVGEIFPLNLDQFFERFYHLKGKEYYINDFSLKNVNPSKRETGVTGEIYFKIEGNLLRYTIPELNKGFNPWLSILIITEDDKRYEVDIHFNVQKRTFVPPNVDKNKTG